ncbi:MAG: hypothetical protein R3F60_19170 [bacterium]
MRWVALALALAGCADFEPVILDYRQALPALSELGGVVARDTGLVVAGTTAGAGRSSFAVATLGDGGRLGTPLVAGGLAEGAQVSGLVALPDGGLVAFGHGGAGVVAVQAGADGQRIATGTLGAGIVARAGIVDAAGRLVVVGQANVGDGTGDTALWAGIFRLTGTGFEVVGEDTWRVEASRSAEARAVTALADGGFLVGGVFAGPVDGQPVLLRLDADGDLATENLHPDAERTGQVGALLALADGRVLVADEAGGHGRLGVMSLAAPADWRPIELCVAGLSPVRPVSLALDADRIALAGWAGFSERRLWLVRADAALGDLQLWTPGALTASATARISTGFSNEGGLYLGSTLCTAAESTACLQAETAGPRPTVWYVDAAGAGLGAAASPECP